MIEIYKFGTRIKLREKDDLVWLGMEGQGCSRKPEI